MTLRTRTMLLVGCLLAALTCLLPAGALAASHGNGGATATTGKHAAPSKPHPAPRSGRKHSRGHRRGDVTSTGGISPDDPRFAPAQKGRIVAGLAVPPAGAPPEVVEVIQAANQIVRMPYRWGGGHQDFVDTAYDCSGSVSFALHGAGFVTSPLDSSSFMSWGVGGRGKWITVYTNPTHAFVVIAGLRFDTGFRNHNVPGTFPGSGPRWGKTRPTAGFLTRHPAGF